MDGAESIVFRRPAIDRKKKDIEGKYLTRDELISCTGHYTNQALRTLKRMQSKALEWKLLRETSKITLAEARGRDRLIDDQTEVLSGRSLPEANQASPNSAYA